jgi:hypothetical protein
MEQKTDTSTLRQAQCRLAQDDIVQDKVRGKLQKSYPDIHPQIKKGQAPEACVAK